MADWFVYLLVCGDGSLYAGSTNDLAHRVATHTAGKGGKYTRAHLPIKLAYTEQLSSKSAALKREFEIKRLTRVEKLLLINGR
ncbi:MAG: GIY-YIG nuclease family protein [Patescibacteria group bacterium]